MSITREYNIVYIIKYNITAWFCVFAVFAVRLDSFFGYPTLIFNKFNKIIYKFVKIAFDRKLPFLV